MAKFNPEIYSKYRILYPSALFDGLRPYWSKICAETEAPLVLDLGAGTGFSALSFARVFPGARFRLVEPDPAMCAEIARTMEAAQASFQIEAASAQNFAVSPQVHLVLIGSAWHWMASKETLARLDQVLLPGGVVFVFEYQFPRATNLNSLELNEWIRRKFNTDWRAPGQVPRGSLKELTDSFRCTDIFSEQGRVAFKKEEQLSFSDLVGVIRSQSRFHDSKDDWETEMKKSWGTEDARSFSYSFEAYLFHKRR